MRYSLLQLTLMLGIALSAFSPVVATENPATQEATASTALLVDPERLVRTLYQQYLDPEGSTALPEVLTQEATDMYLTGKLKDTVLAFLNAQEKDPEVSLGFDPLVDGQDFKIENLKVKAIKAEASQAEVIVTFLNFDEKRELLFHLVKQKEANHWQLAEVTCKRGAEGRSYTLVKELDVALKALKDH